ncbi:hypothetical protein [Paenibacillus sp. MMS18-CY102]|uniref:hypothetical protein n=1 Tax=Paenibacillus sp. MMS18-CY102 TaxID=2682849 RepID=UPI0013653AC1|nr:hypothetical protein [Paenibacillus sp. MMS18-CY102]MWC29261.1 hypothetical protein [Paenibacillus sp. MMS18-CY102]
MNELNELTCIIEGCSKTVKAKGLCAMHHQRMLRHGDPQIVKTRSAKQPVRCNWIGCVRSAISKGWCSKHYYINRTYGGDSRKQN